MVTPLSAPFDRSIGGGLRRGTNRVLQVGIVAALLAGLRKREPSVVVNGVVSLCFTFLPRVLERRYGASVRPWQRLWVSAAALVHALGMLGPYDRIWWWDRLAHTLSGVVVAGAADVFYRATVPADGASATADRSRSRPRPRPRSRSAFVVGVTLAFGLLWEGLEYAIHAVADRLGFEPLLVHYGRLDTVGDIVCDLLGAILVVRFGRRPLSNVVDSVAEE